MQAVEQVLLKFISKNTGVNALGIFVARSVLLACGCASCLRVRITFLTLIDVGGSRLFCERGIMVQKGLVFCGAVVLQHSLQLQVVAAHGRA